jgi:hypothetical protein
VVVDGDGDGDGDESCVRTNGSKLGAPLLPDRQ